MPCQLQGGWKYQTRLTGCVFKTPVTWDWSNSKLDKRVRAVQQSLSGRPEELEQKSKAVSSGLLPAAVQFVQLEEVKAWDNKQWCGLCWDALEAASAQTQFFFAIFKLS